MLLNINVHTETIMSCVRTEAASSFCKLHNGQFSLVNLEKNPKNSNHSFDAFVIFRCVHTRQFDFYLV